MYIEIVMLVSDSMGIQELVNSRRQPALSGSCTACQVEGVRYGNNVCYPSATVFTARAHSSRVYFQSLERKASDKENDVAEYLHSMSYRKPPQLKSLEMARRDISSKSY